MPSLKDLEEMEKFDQEMNRESVVDHVVEYINYLNANNLNDDKARFIESLSVWRADLINDLYEK